MGMLDKQVLTKTNLLLYAKSLPFQPVALLIILSNTGCKSSLLSLSKCRGIPNYFKGKEPMGQFNKWHIS
jgi:hypothetical protein